MRAMAGSRSRYGTAPPGSRRERRAPTSGTLQCHSVSRQGDGQTVAMASASADNSMFLDRAARARALMAGQGIDVLLLSVGHDLPYLTGYLAMPLERLTMLVLPMEGEATLVVPRLEAPRVVERPEVFTLRPWDETEDPVAIVAGLAGAGGHRAPSPSATRPGPASSSISYPSCPQRSSGGPSRSSDRSGCARTRRRWRRSPPRRRPPTVSPPSSSGEPSRSSAVPRRRCPPSCRPACWPRATTR